MNNEENVLFLCYNKALCEHLRNNYSQSNIDFYNIDAFACSYCKTGIADYKLLKNKITDDYLDGNFKYKHVIVDEGQDFGQSEIEEKYQIKSRTRLANINLGKVGRKLFPQAKYPIREKGIINRTPLYLSSKNL